MGRGEDQLMEAVKLQELPIVQRLVQRGREKLLGSAKKVNINHQDNDGYTALHQAALLGNAQLVCLLLDANASVDLRDKKGLRPLHYCAWKGKVELVAALLGSGSNCNLPAHNGISPLHLAAQYGHAQVCKILLEYGAELTARQSDGCSPLDLACEFGRMEVAELLLRSKNPATILEQLRVRAPDVSPLHLAARNGHTGAVRLLLQSGCDINWRTSAGSCLHEAVSCHNTEIVQLLIDCGIDVTIRSGLGQTAIELAQKLSKSPAILRKLSEVQPRLLQVYAINDFQNILDRDSLAFTKGTLITVLEQNPTGNWRGRIEGSHGEAPSIGTFPASYVQPCRPGPSYAKLAGSDDSGIHPHDEDAPTPWSGPHWGRASSKSHPIHSYINLDPRSSQPPTKTPQAAPSSHAPSPTVVNPSYEDVIKCSQPEQPITNVYVTRDRPITSSKPAIVKGSRRDAASPRRDPGIPRSRPSISNPGYEDVLTPTSSGEVPASTLPPHPITSGRHPQASRNVSNQTRQQEDMQNSARYDQINHWLASFGMGRYAPNFIEHGYDFPTAVRASPSDLAAIRVLNPGHRRAIADRGAMLKQDPSTRLPFSEQLPRTVPELLKSLGLEQYVGAFARNGVDCVEKLAHTTWEELQEMGITQLGHQKKLMLAFANIAQLLKRQPPAPNVSPKTNALVGKPPVREKPMTSLGGKGGLSSELQKALNKRQRIIDDAEASPPQIAHSNPPLPTNSSQSPHPNAHLVSQPTAGNDVTKQRRNSNSRGPPPSLPKRVSSMVLEDAFNAAPPAGHVVGGGNPGCIEAGEIRGATNGVVAPQSVDYSPNPTPGSGKASVNSTPGGAIHSVNVSPSGAKPFLNPSPVNTKPPVMPKTKPAVMKKPIRSLQSIPRQTQPQEGPSPVSPRALSSPVSPRFDLSALDAVEKSNVKPASPKGNHGAYVPESGDDFQWPAPPPMEAPPPPLMESPAPLPASVERADTPHKHSSAFPATKPSFPTTNHHSAAPSPRPGRQAPPPPHPNASSDKTSGPISTSLQRDPVRAEDTRQPGVPAYAPTPSSSDRSAPPLPEKMGKSPKPTTFPSEPPTVQQVGPPAMEDTNPLSVEDAGSTQQMLDDITSMFDGLAQEFDDFLQ